MVLDHHIFNTSEETQPQLLKAAPLYIIVDIVSLTVNHTLSNHVVFTLREKNEWLYSLKCKALYLTFWCENPTGPGPEGAEHSHPCTEHPWLLLKPTEVAGIQQLAGSTL